MVEQQSTRRTVIGKVISNKMDKTIVVEIERKVKHALYGKYMRRFSKMYAHDEKNACSIGDLVMIQQSRPFSKTKHWILVEVMERAEKEVNV
jgi:small subunit ribosomal protein S17